MVGDSKYRSLQPFIVLHSNLYEIATFNVSSLVLSSRDISRPRSLQVAAGANASLTQFSSLTGASFLLQVAIHYVVQYSQTLLFCLNPCSLQPPRVCFSSSGHPPCDKCNDRTSPNQDHSTGKTLPVPRSVSLSEYLWTDCTTDLAVTVDKANAEGRSRGAACCLDPPRPHKREEGSSESISNQRGSIYGSVRWVDHEDTVAGEDDSKNRKRVDWSGEFPVIGKESSNTNHSNSENGDGEVQKLSASNSSETKVGNDGWLVEPYSRSTNGEGGPNEGEEPQPAVLQRVDNLANIEVLLGSPWGIRGQARLEESLLLFSKPFR